MEIHLTDDFDLDKTARSGQCFRWQRESGGQYRIIHKGAVLRIGRTGEDAFRLNCTEEEYHTLWRPYFDLDENYRLIRQRIDPGVDPFLYAAAAYAQGVRILRQDPWETLVSFIISQNKNIPAIMRSIDLLCRAAGERLEEDCFSFPTPQAVLRLSQAQLMDCKLGYRWKYVQAAAQAVAEGSVTLEALIPAPEEEALARLMELLGVGVKVASCVSLFGLHHINAFPVDVWMKRVLENEYPGGYPFEAYSPYNGIYQQYMFLYYREMGKAA